MSIDNAIVSKLIQVGNTYPAKIPPGTDSSLDLKPEDVNFGKYKWVNTMSKLSLADLSALLRGVVLVLDLEEIHPNLHRFSAMQIRWIFKYLQRKDYEENGNYDFSTYIADQLLANTSRCDVPLGSESNFGAKTYRELIEQRASYRKWCEYVSDRLEERRKIAEVHRKIRRKQGKKTALHRGTLYHKKYIEDLNSLPIEEQLIKMSNDDKFSVGFYPAYLAHKANQEVIVRLDENIKLKILAKLKGKRRGPWGRFKKRLLKSFRSDGYDFWTSPLDRNNLT